MTDTMFFLRTFFASAPTFEARFLALGFLLFAICFHVPVCAKTKANRVALVIGNDTYQKVPTLANARSDARAIAMSLQKAGFDVILRTDLNERDMRQSLRLFKARLSGGTDAVFYFSGHGVQLGAANYLLPVDISPETEEQVKDEGLALQKVLDDLAEQRTRFAVAIIDACRDNPFARGTGRSIAAGKGLAAATPATGQMVLFAAGAGQTALDRLGPNDNDSNGVFTRVLLREMERPGVPIDRILKSVRQEVVRLAQEVGREQVPALYDQSIGEFFFIANDSARAYLTPPISATPIAQVVTNPKLTSEEQREDNFWDDTKSAGNREAFEAYLRAYPRGRYTNLAKANIGKLRVSPSVDRATSTERTSPEGISTRPPRTEQSRQGNSNADLTIDEQLRKNREQAEPILSIFKKIIENSISK